MTKKKAPSEKKAPRTRKPKAASRRPAESDATAGTHATHAEPVETAQTAARPAARRKTAEGARTRAPRAAVAPTKAPPADAPPKVEARGDEVVIRFPPAAPSPFPTREATSPAPAAQPPAPRPAEPPRARETPRPAPQPAPPADRAPAFRPEPTMPPLAQPRPISDTQESTAREAPRTERTDRPRDDRRHGRRGDRRDDRRGDRHDDRGGGRRDARSDNFRETQPPAREPAAPGQPRPEPAAQGADDDLQHLSPSQKRRLRRKRRRQLSDTGAPAAAPWPAGRAPEREAAGRVEPPAADAARPAVPPVDEHETPFDEEPWEADVPELDAAVARAELVEEPADADQEDDGVLFDEVEDERPEGEFEGDEDDGEGEGEGESAGAAVAPAREGRPRERDRDRDRRGGRRGRRFRRYSDDEAAPAPTLIEVIEPEEAPRAEGARPTREMIINVVKGEECRIAIIHQNRLEEIYIERASAENYVSNIYKGVVTNVEPSIQAAFINFGIERNGFLHISDLHPQYFPNNSGATENVGRKMPRRHRPPIQKCLRRGQELLVQVTKEGIGTKGPTLTTYLSIPGRFLVMMPGMGRLGVSRRIEDEDARGRVRAILNELSLPKDMGFIARTAAVNRTKSELQNDLDYLTRLWRAVENRIKSERAPADIYHESDLLTRTIRDVFTSDIGQIIVDEPDVARRAREFLGIFSPRSADLVVDYTSPEPIFHKYGIEAELEALHSRRVPLRSGGSLVIDQTEALVAIDVNSGKFRTEDDAETTAYKINLEAADEIPRQLRLRDLGGVIICDFIDLRHESHRRTIERRLIDNLKKHKERAKVLRMSAFGIIEMTRQRQRASLQRSAYQDCVHCRGAGLVKTVESVALDVMRLLQLASTREHIQSIEVLCSGEVAGLLLNRKRRLIYDLEQKYRRTISIRPEPHFGLDQVDVRCTDSRGRLVPNN